MIRLLSTDFDGTLVEHEASPAVEPTLFDALRLLRGRGVYWAINTGRELAHIEEGLAEFHFPLAPDYVLTAEREVFHRGADGRWQDFGEWNRNCARAHDELFARADEFIADVQGFLARETRAHAVYDGLRMVGIAAESDEEMDRITAFLDAERVRVPGFCYMRNTIYVRFCHEAYSKGTALGELGRLLGIPASGIFAAGDHYNDIPMLDGRHAGWVMCPSNATPTVKRVVEAAGGYVALRRCSAGVVEALRHFGVI